MLVNDSNRDIFFRGAKTACPDAFMAAETTWSQLAMRIASTAESESYGWLGDWPGLRKWVGARAIHKLRLHGFTLRNVTYESTVSIGRELFEDDRLGIFAPMFRQMGHATALHPEELVYSLIADGFDALGYDGQPYFDTEHPVTDESGATTLVSNMQSGSEPAWFLFDLTQPLKPFIFQERIPYEFTALNRPEDAPMFLNNEMVLGVRARVNAGYGLWQLSFGSKAALTATNYSLARAAMQRFRSADGRLLGVRPTALVCPPELEEDARRLLNSTLGEGGESNPWAGSARLIVSPQLEG